MSSINQVPLSSSYNLITLTSVVLTGGGGAASANLTQSFFNSNINSITLQGIYTSVVPIDIRFSILSPQRVGISNVQVLYGSVIGTLPAASFGVVNFTIFNSSKTSTEQTSAKPTMYNDTQVIMTDNTGAGFTIGVNKAISNFYASSFIPNQIKLFVQNMDSANSLTFTKINYMVNQ